LAAVRPALGDHLGAGEEPDAVLAVLVEIAEEMRVPFLRTRNVEWRG
jgi:hypothetical protein